MSTVKTSESDPIRIAAVTSGRDHGRIGVTLCPGKTDPNGISGAWKRDLDTDLDAIQRWGATAVVTLIEKREFDLLKVRDLPTKVRDRHMEWWHLPIQDGKSPPARGFEDRWAVAGEALRDRLRLGFDVLVHCRGGLGRAGTVAARLLVELGAHPDRAIRSVRDVRPGALETEDQEDHVAQCSAQPPTAPSKDPESIRDRALGAFLGLAVGDAVGTTLEFCSRDAQPRLEDMVGGGPFDLPPGYWTDDTAMALALADSLAASETLDCRVSTVSGKRVILDRTATTTCRGRMSGHRQQEPVWTSVRGAGVRAVSPAERGRSEATRLDAGEHTRTLLG